MPLANEFGTKVGEVDLEVHRGNGGFQKAPLKNDLHSVKRDLAKVNRSIEHVEKSMEKKNRAKHRSLSKHDPQAKGKRHSLEKNERNGFELPPIKSKNNDRISNLVKMLQIKKRGNKNVTESLAQEEKPHRIQTHGNNRSLVLKKVPDEKVSKTDRYHDNVGEEA